MNRNDSTAAYVSTSLPRTRRDEPERRSRPTAPAPPSRGLGAAATGTSRGSEGRVRKIVRPGEYDRGASRPGTPQTPTRTLHGHWRISSLRNQTGTVQRQCARSKCRSSVGTSKPQHLALVRERKRNMLCRCMSGRTGSRHCTRSLRQKLTLRPIGARGSSQERLVGEATRAEYRLPPCGQYRRRARGARGKTDLRRTTRDPRMKDEAAHARRANKPGNWRSIEERGIWDLPKWFVTGNPAIVQQEMRGRRVKFKKDCDSQACIGAFLVVT